MYKDLVLKAREARKLSYSPYSKFEVGAALLCKDGKVFVGANIENSSYPLCMCAERNALYHAMMNGYQKDDFIALAIVADTPTVCSPWQYWHKLRIVHPYRLQANQENNSLHLTSH